ncbi:sensor histidine kinase [Paenibacillus sp. GM2]|uniref:sensor histidine kinase n=1 Tax=Paenibacillus sp. GM2 TaxID=1622070 RepID=UPI0008390E5F|nr:sensor histidine kinase [Paenibacillus sp. GM2]
MGQNASRKTSRLFNKLSLPLLGLIVVFIVLSTTASSYILIQVQNNHTLKMAEQSMEFVHRNVWYQFDTMKNVSAFVRSNQFIDNLIDRQYKQDYESIGDFFELEKNLQNLSLLSLLHNVASNNAVQTTYSVSMLLEPTSSLYSVSPAHFFGGTGIYQANDLIDAEWYQRLNRNESEGVWWAQPFGTGNVVYLASRKLSYKDGRNIGTVMVGADTRSIQGVIGNAPIDKGYYLLLDEKNQVIYSARHSFMDNLSGTPYVQSLHGAKGTVKATVDNESYRIMYDSFDNGWKLVALVPESHFSRYTFMISMICAVIGIVALLVSGFWMHSIVTRVTVPISRLVSAMQRKDVLQLEQPLPSDISEIYEINELNQQFSAMLVMIRQLIEKSFTEEIERRQLQLELLQAQINPHFLYNTLDLINCRALISGDMETSMIVRSLANVFRYGLNKGKTWIPLKDEACQVEAYLDIQKQMLDDLTIRIDIPEELAAVQVIHLILQPLAENCIVHGFANQTSKCRIAISARRESESVILRVEDNGSGVDSNMMNQRLARESSKEKSSEGGYGTLNVHRRIVLNCKERKGEYGLRYIRVPNGTCVEAVMPFIAEADEAIKNEGGLSPSLFGNPASEERMEDE